jgi:serine phosphatase RsbU (regulator of sigma subunit)
MLVEQLRASPLLADLPQDDLGRLAAAAQVVEFAPGDLLFREGDLSECVAVILGGEIEIIKALGEPAEQTLGIRSSGDVLGELGLLRQTPLRTASARTRQPTQLAQIPYRVFEDLLERRPALAFHLLREIVERMRSSESAFIGELTEKNRRLTQALEDLKASQARLVQQEILEHELQMARRMQESLLPHELPSLPGWRLAAHWQPARAVSGDFYDFFPLRRGELALVIGDVSDKGVPASLVMTATRSMLRASAARQASPGKILAQTNRLLLQDIPAHMFVTCLFTILEPATGRLRFANAGHCRPLLSSAEALFEPSTGGFPLGLLPGRVYEDAELVIPSGGQILMYSDGLPEAHAPDGAMYSFERLRAWLGANAPGRGAAEVIGGLLASLREFTGQVTNPEDDVTLVVLERDG